MIESILNEAIGWVVLSVVAMVFVLCIAVILIVTRETYRIFTD